MQTGHNVYARLFDLEPMIGREIGVSDWLLIDQQRIDMFAQCTGDLQWIHIDPDRAATGPFGGPIAHGFLTLSLLPILSASAVRIEDVTMSVNYGLNRVRFPSPLPVNSRVRGRVSVMSFERLNPGAQIVTKVTVEREGHEKPVCVAEAVSRRYT
ncbi:MAG: MaoC family dehydratase [Akkermansiaceae bacterium]|nr:MaoC family dehydratase [Akkermansiaceae bacterium]